MDIGGNKETTIHRGERIAHKIENKQPVRERERERIHGI